MASPRKWGGICRCKDQVYHKAWSFCVRGLGNSLDLSRFHSKRISTTISLWKTNTAGYKESRWCQCAICMVWDFQDSGVKNNLSSHHQDKIKENFPSSIWESILSMSGKSQCYIQHICPCPLWCGYHCEFSPMDLDMDNSFLEKCC
jgi:hypothetical protein